MPDNQAAGSLEHFLSGLVPSNDSTYPHARTSTETALGLGAPLRPVDLQKGTLYTWLAWQHPPGLPFGSAIKAHVFGHDSAASCLFVAWFNRTFAT
jgi:hypothetical protein